MRETDDYCGPGLWCGHTGVTIRGDTRLVAVQDHDGLEHRLAQLDVPEQLPEHSAGVRHLPLQAAAEDDLQSVTGSWNRLHRTGESLALAAVQPPVPVTGQAVEMRIRASATLSNHELYVLRQVQGQNHTHRRTELHGRAATGGVKTLRLEVRSGLSQTGSRNSS